MNLTEVGLTPSQLGELEHVDQALVAAWLVALEHVDPKINSPIGWFLAGVRSGNAPGVVAEPERLTRIRLAERWIRNAGLYEPDERSLVDSLFGEHGRLRELADDEQLVERMRELWRHEQPRADQAELERVDRAERWKAANHATMRVSDHPPSADMDTRTARNPRFAGESLVSAPWSPSNGAVEQVEPLLERVDVGELVDADADIDWAAA